MKLLQVLGAFAFVAGLLVLIFSSHTDVGAILAVLGVVLLVLGTFGDRMEGKQRLTLKVRGQELIMELNLAKVRQLARKADRELATGGVTSLKELK